MNIDFWHAAINLGIIFSMLLAVLAIYRSSKQSKN
jgi:hypothetical protein